MRSPRTRALRLLRGDCPQPPPDPGQDIEPDLTELLSYPPPGVSPDYVVLPRILLDAMPQPWQQHLSRLLYELYGTTHDLAWPDAYRITPLQRTPLTELADTDLHRLGIHVEYNQSGALTYRDTQTGHPVTSPERRTVLTPTADPLVTQPTAASQ